MMRIEEMEAGPRLDALVAEKVMGWQRDACGDLRFWVFERTKDRFPDKPIEWLRRFPWESAGWLITPFDDDDDDYGDLPLLIGGHGVWQPSQAIASAWQVVEHLAKQRIVISLMDQLGFEDEIVNGTGHLVKDMLWRAMFMDLDAHEREAPRGEIWFPVGEANTAPLAICRAALMACGITEVLDE